MGLTTIRLISIVHPQIEGKFTATPGGLTSVFYGWLTSLWSELANAILKKVPAPLEVGPEFAFLEGRVNERLGVTLLMEI